MYFKYILLLVMCMRACLCGEELFKNPGMEDPDIAGAYGYPWGYSMERVTDSHSGDYAVKLANRTEYWMSIGQDVNLQENSMYAASAYIKQLNNNTRLWQRFSLTAAYQWTEDGALLCGTASLQKSTKGCNCGLWPYKISAEYEVFLGGKDLCTSFM